MITPIKNKEKVKEEINDLLNEIKDLFSSKGDEYTPDQKEAINAFNNFVKGAQYRNRNPQQYLWDLNTKHLVSLSDLADLPLDAFSLDLWKEKLKDNILYSCLQYCLVKTAKENEETDTISHLAKKVSELSKHI